MTGIAAAAQADTLAVAPSATRTATGIPITVSFDGSATPFDSSGDMPTLYALVRRANGMACQPTFGQDQQVAGSDDVTVLAQGGGAGPGDVSDGTFTAADTYTPAAGSYTICAWLESDNGDQAGSGDVASQVVTATATARFATPSVPVCVVPKYRSATLRRVKSRLRAASCRIGRIVYRRDRSVSRGQVIHLSARSGSSHPDRTKITITVSKG
jgi:hypothetical protein